MLRLFTVSDCIGIHTLPLMRDTQWLAKVEILVTGHMFLFLCSLNRPFLSEPRDTKNYVFRALEPKL